MGSKLSVNSRDIPDYVHLIMAVDKEDKVRIKLLVHNVDVALKVKQYERSKLLECDKNL